MGDSPEGLLRQAISAARTGQKEYARQLLVRILRDDPRSETAWLWMSAVVDTSAERLHCLKQVLAINPHNAAAQKGIQTLGGEHAGRPSLQAQPGPVPAVSVPPPVPGGVPLVSAEAITRAQREAEAVLAAIRAEEQQGTLTIAWAAPGELPRRPVMGVDLRPSPMVLVIGASLILVAVVIVIMSSLTGRLRARQVAADSTPSPTPTVTLAPTDTPTPRPTRTPPPPDQLGGPEPTLPVGDAPRGDLRFGLTPTAPYVMTPHPSDPALEQAAAAFYEGRYQDALTLVEEARTSGEAPVDIYYFEALAYLRLGDVSRAARVVEEGLGRDPGFAPLHIAKAEIDFQQGRYEQARLAAEQARSLDPRLVAAYLSLAELDLREGNYEAALADVEAGRTVRPHDVNLLVTASRVYLALGDAESAVAHANLAHYIDPAAEPVVVALARGRLALGLGMRAVIDLEDYIFGVNPSSADAWTLLGEAYGRQSRLADAQAAYTRALDLSGGAAPPALVGRGRLYLEQGRYDLAYADLDAALKAGVDDASLLLDHARAAFAIGEYGDVLNDLETIRIGGEVDPTVEVLYLRALVEEGHYQDAADQATQLLGLALTLPLDERQQADLYESRARAYYALGRYAEARADIDRALAIEETGLRRYTSALVAAAQGDDARALRELEWVLYWDATFGYPFATEAAERLAELQAAQLTPTPAPTAAPAPSL